MAAMREPCGQGGRSMKDVIVITGASSGFGALAARALRRAGHTVYASMRETTGRNARPVAEAQKYAAERAVELRTIELDVASEASADAAIEEIVTVHGRLDVVIHNAGHMVFGPAEAFTPEQFAELYDVNVLSAQRVNRAALPQLRRQGKGLLIWVSSSSSAGGTPPYLAPYFAAKAAMDALAVVYARELTRWGIETSIIVPGALPAARITSPALGRPPTRHGPLNTKRVLMRVSRTRCSKASPPSCRPMRMSLQSRTPSSGWSIPPLASDRSGCTLTRRRMARRSSMPSRIVSAPSFFVGLASATCWHREHPEVDFWSVGARRCPGIAGGSKSGENQDHATRSFDTTEALSSCVMAAESARWCPMLPCPK